jgi:rRNA-processing protein FCF1
MLSTKALDFIGAEQVRLLANLSDLENKTFDPAVLRTAVEDLENLIQKTKVFAEEAKQEIWESEEAQRTGVSRKPEPPPPPAEQKPAPKGVSVEDAIKVSGH